MYVSGVRAHPLSLMVVYRKVDSRKRHSDARVAQEVIEVEGGHRPRRLTISVRDAVEGVTSVNGRGKSQCCPFGTRALTIIAGSHTRAAHVDMPTVPMYSAMLLMHNGRFWAREMPRQ